MEKTRVTFLDEKRVLVETVYGKNYVVMFSSNYHYQLEECGFKFTNFFASLFDKYYRGDANVIMGDICRGLAQANLELVFGYGEDRDVERKRIGKRIKQLRTRKGLDIETLARQAMINPTNLIKIEDGRYSIKYDVLASIASALNMKIDFVEL
ncbi:MAG: helix-turn-helix transcriptional regulator [Paludibacteraceae bacterium]|nr:helix-turn-helix transcriptional regulator [Paludibacteraceae bacterium]MBQ9672609.1 helix-turn-helix transcriptional regulator [Prevotella sp.]